MYLLLFAKIQSEKIVARVACFHFSVEYGQVIINHRKKLSDSEIQTVGIIKRKISLYRRQQRLLIKVGKSSLYTKIQKLREKEMKDVLDDMQVSSQITKNVHYKSSSFKCIADGKAIHLKLVG